MITDDITKAGESVTEINKILGPEHDQDKWELIVKNQTTGEEIIHYRDVFGGVLVVAQGKPSETEVGSTRQGVFGSLSSIMICYYKSKFVLKQILKKHLGSPFDALEKLDSYKDIELV